MELPLQIKDLLAGKVLPGKTIVVNGWVRTRRDSKGGFSFLSMHDGSCFAGIQVVADKKLANYEHEIVRLSAGCSLRVEGVLTESEGKEQSLEIQATTIHVYGWVDDPDAYPIAKKRHTFEFLRSVAHLRPRTNTFGAMTRIRNACAYQMHQYFKQRGFYWVNTPIITASDCEGAGELFRVSTLDFAKVPRSANGDPDFTQDFFGSEAYLTVSGQLNAESYCMAMSRVYTFGPTFRAENSNTSRHLAEFWMVEPEIAFADLAADAQLAENFLKVVIQNVLDECEQDIAFFTQRIDKHLMDRLSRVVKTDFVHLDYSDAIQVLNSAKVAFEFPVVWGADLQSEHERYLAEEYVGGPVIIMNYPKEIKAFYMRENDDGLTCAAMDVLVPGIGELIGGSQREERLDVLEAKMEQHGLQKDLWWYRDLRRYGTVPHAGFGLGFERFLNYMTGMENIRDAIPFPRAPKSASF